MLKFIVILISLLMIAFGCMFLITMSNESMLNSVKENCKYNDLSSGDREKFDKFVRNATNRSFIAFVFGICLFVASMFL